MINFKEWEEVPMEDFFMDGELANEKQAMINMFVKVRNQGIWKIIRRKVRRSP